MGFPGMMPQGMPMGMPMSMPPTMMPQGMPMGMPMSMPPTMMGSMMGAPMMGAPMGMASMHPSNGPEELPGDKLSPMECMQYGVPQGAVWGAVQSLDPEMETEDDVRGTQV